MIFKSHDASIYGAHIITACVHESRIWELLNKGQQNLEEKKNLSADSNVPEALTQCPNL